MSDFVRRTKSDRYGAGVITMSCRMEIIRHWNQSISLQSTWSGIQASTSGVSQAIMVPHQEDDCPIYAR